MIFGRHWMCWLFGHRTRKYGRRGFWSWVFEKDDKRTIRVCKRGCGVIQL